VKLLADSPARISEAMHVVEQRRAFLLAESEKSSLDHCRMDDDRLETAILHRDEMRFQLTCFHQHQHLCAFVQTYRHVQHMPTLRPCEASTACARWVRKLVRTLGGTRKVFADAYLLQKVHHETIRWLGLLETYCRRNASSASEVVLLCSLTELSRAAMQLCCAHLRDMDAAGVIETLKPVTSNTSILHHSDGGRQHLKMLFDLLTIARHTVVHRVCDEVRAHVSLLIAELMSIFDQLFPPEMAMAPVARRSRSTTVEVCCTFTGIPLTPEECVEVQGKPVSRVVAPYLRVWGIMGD
jgi:hypothetical protein